MRIGLVMDASCDVPRDCVEKHQITVLPVHVDVGGKTFIDRRDDVEIERFLAWREEARNAAAHAEPCSVEAMQALFLEQLVTRFDCVFCLTPADRKSTRLNSSHVAI